MGSSHPQNDLDDELVNKMTVQSEKKSVDFNFHNIDCKQSQFASEIQRINKDKSPMLSAGHFLTFNPNKNEHCRDLQLNAGEQRYFEDESQIIPEECSVLQLIVCCLDFCVKKLEEDDFVASFLELIEEQQTLPACVYSIAENQGAAVLFDAKEMLRIVPGRLGYSRTHTNTTHKKRGGTMCNTAL